MLPRLRTQVRDHVVGYLAPFLALVAVITLGAAAQSAAAPPSAPPPTLDGEFLTCGGGSNPFCFPGASVTITDVTCDPAGTSSFRYRATGAAGGPYNGTFDERGRVTLGPQTTPFGSSFAGQLLSLTAFFQVQADEGHVVGWKRLTSVGPVHTTRPGLAFAQCGETLDTPPIPFAGAASSSLCYEAVLPRGTRDSGTSELQVFGAHGSGAGLGIGIFDESFESDPTVSCPPGGP